MEPGDDRQGVEAFLQERSPDLRSKVSVDMPPFYGESMASDAAPGMT